MRSRVCSMLACTLMDNHEREAVAGAEAAATDHDRWEWRTSHAAPAAQYADSFGGDPATVAHSFDVLRQHRVQVARSFGVIPRSHDVSLLIAPNQKELAAKKERHGDRFDLVGTPDEILEGLQRYAQVGSQHVTFHMPDAADIEPILLLGETVVRC